MRTLSHLAAVSLAVILIASCGTSKKATSQYGRQLEMTESQELAYESPSTRAWGDAVGYNLSQATAYAEGQARAKMARAISSVITTATEESNLTWEQYASNGDRGAIAIDEGGKRTSSTLQIAQEAVAGAVTIHTDQYIQSNDQYHVFVCLEYQGDIAAKAADITDRIKQQVSDEDRQKMEEEFQEFEQKVQKELEGLSMEAE